MTVRAQLHRYRWQGIHHAHAELAVQLQKQARHRMGENDAWQAAVALHMNGFVVGHDRRAFGQLGAAYLDFRA